MSFAWLAGCGVSLLLMSAGLAQARGYHVSPSGDDAAPGTLAQPWRTIARANRADLGPGDRLLFEAGKTFAGMIALTAADSGAEGKRVEVGSYGEGRATIDGGKGRALLADGCSHLTIRNLDFAGAGRKQGNTADGVTVRGGADIEVDHIDITGFRGTGLSLAGVRDAHVTHVHAHDNGAAGIGVGQGDRAEWSSNVHIAHCIADSNPGDPSNLTNHSGNGIVVGCVRGCLIEYCEAFNNGWDMPRQGNGPFGIWTWNADRVVIQHCIAHDNKSPGDDGGGFDLDGGVTNSILQYNYSYRNDGPGYFLCQYPTGPVWKHNIVRYNLSVNDCANTNRNCAIDVYGGDAGMSDAEVYHNTVYNEKGGAVGFGGMPAPRIRFRNNILVGTGDLIRGDASPARFEGNCYWSLDGAAFAGPHKTFADWVAATGQEKAGALTLGLYADPRLTDPRLVELREPEQLATLTGFRPRSGSPCLAAALPIADNGDRDLLGAPLPHNTRLTIGACQVP